MEEIMDRIIGTEKVSKKTKTPPPYLPDEIVINILCRLPAKHAMICRLVCRRWRDLTFTRDFVDLHFRHNSIPLIIFTNPGASFYELTILDNWWELPAQTSSKVYHVPFESRLYTHDVLLSQFGLIVFKLSSVVALHFIIFNLVNRKYVRITLPENRSEIYGVFLHPLLKEYCSLLKIHTSKNDDFQYKILNLGPNDPSFKTISYPFGTHTSKRKDVSPLLLDNFLYWMLEEDEDIENYKSRSDIMEYDITREEFNVIPCPTVPLDTECSFSQTHLQVIDGTLSFLLILLNRITIWRLENRVEQLWTSSVSYIFNRDIYQGIGLFRAIVGDGKLAILSDKSLHVYDLKQGLRWHCWKDNMNGVLSHQMSLASLRNCKSTIHIGQDGQVLLWDE